MAGGVPDGVGRRARTSWPGCPAATSTCAGAGGRLDYLGELGVRYLHLMPLLAPREGDSDGGYAVRDYRAVDLDLRQRSCSRSRARHPIGPLLAVHNVTEQPQRVSPMALHLVGDDHPVDRITGQPAHVDHGGVVLEPYQAVWLSAGPLANPAGRWKVAELNSASP